MSNQKSAEAAYRMCRCGHDVQAHQYQGPHANWPCNGLDGTLDDCSCNGFAPVASYDPYLVAHLQAETRTRVDPHHFTTTLWTPGELARHRAIAALLPRFNSVA